MASDRPQVPQRKPRNKNVKRNAKLFDSNSSAWTRATEIPPPYVGPLISSGESEGDSDWAFMVETPLTQPSFDIEQDFEREIEQDFEREMWRRMGITMPSEQETAPTLAMEPADTYGLDSSTMAASGFDHFSRLVICQARLGFQQSMLTEKNLAMHNSNHAVADSPCFMKSMPPHDIPNGNCLVDFCLLARQIPTLKALCRVPREVSYRIMEFLGEFPTEGHRATLASEDAPAGEHVTSGNVQGSASSVSTPSQTASNVSSCEYQDEILTSRATTMQFNGQQN